MLHAGEGFAEFLAEVSGGFVERLENLFLACGFGLLTSEGIARLRVGGFERDDVIAAQAGDGAGDDGLGVFALRNFLGKVASDALVGFSSHEAKSILDFGFGEKV